jgi:hypothetical protein
VGVDSDFVSYYYDYYDYNSGDGCRAGGDGAQV